MIVRIATESQWRLSDEDRDRLNELDNQAVSAVEKSDEAEFRRLTLRALDDFGDLGRLLRSPLIDLPTVDRRLTGQGAEKPLARAIAHLDPADRNAQRQRHLRRAGVGRRQLPVGRHRLQRAVPQQHRHV